MHSALVRATPPVVIALALAFAPCPWIAAPGPACAEPAASVAGRNGQDVQEAVQRALRGYWAGSRDGRDVVLNFAGAFLACSEAEGFNRGFFLVAGGELELDVRPWFAGGKRRIPFSLEGGELVLGDVRFRRLPEAGGSFGLSPEDATMTRLLAERDHAMQFCGAVQGQDERKLVQDWLAGSPERRALYMEQRLESGSVRVYDPAGWCRDSGVRRGAAR
jgi:hypothetical protein